MKKFIITAALTLGLLPGSAAASVQSELSAIRTVPHTVAQAAHQRALAVELWRRGGDRYTTLPRAHSAGCWRGEVNPWTHYIAGGANVTQIYVAHSGWCGSGGQITFGGLAFYFHHWAQYPYCLTNLDQHWGWDGSRRWAHGGIWVTAGVYTIAFICAPILGSQKRTLRIAGNGHWDGYDDFGF